MKKALNFELVIRDSAKTELKMLFFVVFNVSFDTYLMLNPTLKHFYFAKGSHCLKCDTVFKHKDSFFILKIQVNTSDHVSKTIDVLLNHSKLLYLQTLNGSRNLNYVAMHLVIFSHFIIICF